MSIDWKELGRRDAREHIVDPLEDGFGSQVSSAPWDVPPDEWEELSPEEQDELEQSASSLYNEGWKEVEVQLVEQSLSAKGRLLKKADDLGYRICQFGLPGSQSWTVRVAVPGKADKVSRAIYNPGPSGPYDSSILLPSEADRECFRDGTPMYQSEIEDILSHVQT